MPTINRALNTIVRCGALYRAERLAGTGIGPYDHSYLYYICRNPGVPQEELGRALYVNKSSVTRHLAHLEAEGYLTRTPDADDRRVLRVDPTERALAALPLLREIGDSWRAALTEGFTDAERETLERLLDRAFDNARRAVEGKS